MLILSLRRSSRNGNLKVKKSMWATQSEAIPFAI